MQELLISSITALVGAFLGWFFKRRQEKQDVLAAQLENANKLMVYYQDMCNDLGARLLGAIQEIEKTNLQLKQAKEDLDKARIKLVELEKIVTDLTNELSKYKQLNGKKP